jgi:NAD(P)-dependent dehydrogenase (short-subunit alcohol dehydrogenase family)
MSELSGETAVVTGGASGNGRAIARLFAAEGTDIVVADRRESPREGGHPTHETIQEETSVDAIYVECDVTDLDLLEEAISAADEFGGVSILVNNAGIFDPGPFQEVTPEDYDRMMAVNARAPFFGTQFAADRMVDTDREGAVVNVSSVAGLRGMAGGATYCASKGAVTLLTYALADELGPDGIRVNAAHPGYVETAMFEQDVPGPTDRAAKLAGEIPLRRVGQPADIAEAVLYLASDRGGYVTGASLTVDGGITNTE